MRAHADVARIRELLERLGRNAPSPVRLYLTGGATAVLVGWQSSTVDVDLYLEPDDDVLLRSITDLKASLDINVKLASPPDFIPELPGWRERSKFVEQIGKLTVLHFDPYSQALSKLERGFDQDQADVAALETLGLIDRAKLLELFEAIEPGLYRYPAIDPAVFRAAVERFCQLT